MSNRFAAILLAIHLLYLFLLPSLSGRAVALVGCAVTLALIVFLRLFAAAADDGFGPLDRFRSALMLAVFALPLVSWLGQPQIAFWRLDGRALLILSWLGTLAILVAARSAHPVVSDSPQRWGRPPVLTQLVMVWSVAFWLMVIWDVGVGRAVLEVARDDRLTSSFALWETERASDHLFLVWLNRAAFDGGIAYSNHLHPMTFFFYGCSKLVQLATGLPPYVGRNLTPFAMAALGALAFAALLPRMVSTTRASATFHATLFLVVGFFLSEWHFWVYPFTWNFDTVFPVITYLTAVVWASARPRIPVRDRGRLTIAVVIFGAVGWLYTPLLILALWCLFGQPRRGIEATLAANRTLVRASVAGMIVAVMSFGLPLMLIAIRGYENSSSAFLFRSGLDGDTRYFQNVVQAVVHPFAPARSWWSLFFPGAVLLVISAWCSWASWAAARRRIGRPLLFLLTPYCFSLALFPQSVSIHPYLYDSLLILPVVLLGSVGMLAPWVQRRLRGGAVLAGLLLMVLLIMANLIGISQGVERLLQSAR